jgi:LmbE family N-acetylglucosaminyl deacetylase
MRLDFAGERVLAVVAHPDDAELLCAGTLARARADGAAVGICVLCRGDKGQPIPPIENLADVRRQEMTAAAALLGAELLEGGFPDGELHDGDRERRTVVALYRRFRPTLVLAHAPEDYHPDHRAAGALAEAATWFAPSAGQPSAEPPLETQPALWWMDTINMAGFEPGFFLDVSAAVDVKHRMLNCHRTQLQRGTDRDFSPLMELMQRQYQARGAQAGVAAAEAFRLHLAWRRARAW